MLVKKNKNIVKTYLRVYFPSSIVVCASRCGNLDDGGRARRRCSGTLRAVVVMVKETLVKQKIVNSETYLGLNDMSRHSGLLSYLTPL